MSRPLQRVESSETRPEAVLFDLDGVLLDTTEIVAANWRRFADATGRSLDVATLRRVQGRRTVDALIDVFGMDPASAGVLADRWSEARRLTASERAMLVPIPGTVAFVHACRVAGVRTALVSSASAANVAFAIELIGLAGAFDIVITAADVERGKPYPDPYLAAINRLETIPAATLVIEDSPPGIAAGRAAGARVVALTTTFGDAPDLLASADLVLDDLSGIAPDQLLDRLIGPVG